MTDRELLELATKAAEVGGKQLDSNMKRDNLAMWCSVMVAHAWSVACYVRPGWFPATVSLVSILMAALILYKDKITAAETGRAIP